MTPDTTIHTTKTEARKAKSFARHLPTAARVLMGVIFFVMGLNGFLNFLPQPPTPIPEGAVAFLGALFKTGYMTPLISGTQVIVGVLLLSNRFVPLALALIAPIVLNIFIFHAFLWPSGGGIALFVLVLEVYLAWLYRKAYLPMLALRTGPDTK